MANKDRQSKLIIKEHDIIKNPNNGNYYIITGICDDVLDAAKKIITYKELFGNYNSCGFSAPYFSIDRTFLFEYNYVCNINDVICKIFNHGSNDDLHFEYDIYNKFLRAFSM